MKNDPNCLHFLVDSFPIASCHNIRSARRGLFRGKKYQGYNASKKMWFTGLKVHVLSSVKGQPKEFYISPATMHDLKAFKNMYLGTIPRGSTLWTKLILVKILKRNYLHPKALCFLQKEEVILREGKACFMPVMEERLEKE